MRTLRVVFIALNVLLGMIAQPAGAKSIFQPTQTLTIAGERFQVGWVASDFGTRDLRVLDRTGRNVFPTARRVDAAGRPSGRFCGIVVLVASRRLMVWHAVGFSDGGPANTAQELRADWFDWNSAMRRFVWRGQNWADAAMPNWTTARAIAVFQTPTGFDRARRTAQRAVACIQRGDQVGLRRLHRLTADADRTAAYLATSLALAGQAIDWRRVERNRSYDFRVGRSVIKVYLDGRHVLEIGRFGD